MASEKSQVMAFRGIRRSMNASCQKALPLYTPKIYNQVIDLPVEKSPLILSEPLFQKKRIWNSY